ncbi:hypothetical protein ACOMHN_017940 [Nucella lapillus]
MSSQPDAEAEAEAEISSSEPEVESGTWPESELAEPESWPEVGPEWAVARAAWGEAWPGHVYFFALAFLGLSLLAAYIALTSLLTQTGPRTSMQKTSLGLTLMIASFTLTRALSLLTDPYFSTHVLPFVAARLLWSLGLPGLTASFSTMLLILLDTTRLSLAPPRFQSLTSVTLIWLLHLAVVLLTDLLLLYVKADVRFLLVMCQMLFVLYGALVALGYGYVGVKMRANIKASSQGYHEDDQTKKIRRLVTMTFVSSVVALCVAMVNVYMAVSEFGPYTQVTYVQPWPYWSVQTISRLVLVLFFRSGTGGHSAGPCERCRLWRKKQQSICPEPTSAKSDNATTEITGLQWRQRTEVTSLCKVDP